MDELAAGMIAAGARRIHVLAWRDLDDPDAGGSETHADHFMRRWSTVGLEVTQRTSAAVGLPRAATRDGYSVVRAGSRYSVFSRAVASELVGRMGRSDALVEIWNGVPWLSPIWCRKPRVTFLHHVHGPMWDQLLPRPLASLGRVLETRVAPRIYRRGTTLTPSEATRADLLDLGFRPGRVVAIPNGVDEEYTPGGVRAALPTVVSVARLAPVKRLDELIRAAVVARGRVPDLQLVIVGDGPLRPALQKQIDALGARRWITLAGHLHGPKLVDLYRSAWLVASASLAEGWGLALTEAAACATPAVATDVSGHRSSVIDGVTGVLTPLSRLGDEIADVLLDAPRREELGTLAHRRALTLTWDDSARRILAALYAEVARRRG